MYILIAMSVAIVYTIEIGKNSVFMAGMGMLELTINTISFVVVLIHMKEIDEGLTILV